MESKISIVHRKALLKLIVIKGTNRDVVYSKLLERLNSCKSIIEGLGNTIPTNYSTWSTKNNLDKDFLDIINLASILCLYLLDYKDDAKPIYLNKFNYTLEGLQKVFSHLDKEQLKAIDSSTDYRKGYNIFLKTLTGEGHPFGLIQLDEHWNITGEKCKPVNYINNYLAELDNGNDGKITHSNRNENEIKTILNIKKKGSLFKRFQTILAYFFSFFLLPNFIILIFTRFFFGEIMVLEAVLSVILQIIAILTIGMGFYYTHKYARKPKVILWRNIIFGLMALITVSIITYGIIEADSMNTLLNTNGKFNPDPAKNGTSFFTVNSSRVPNTANKFNSLEIPDLKTGDEFYFYTFIDFHNSGEKDIENAIAKIYLSKDDDVLILTGELSGEGVPSINEVVSIKNYKPTYELIFVDGYIENTHGKNYEVCMGYEYKIDFGSEILKTGVSLGVLDTFERGYCDQGYVITRFKIKIK